MKWIVLLGFIFWGMHQTHAQQNVKIIGDAYLDSLIERNIELNQAANGIQGYRIQIFFGSDRRAANEARTKFLQLYPETEAYLVYQQPNFKVRVGDFRNLKPCLEDC